MENYGFLNKEYKTPCFIVDKSLIKKNIDILETVIKKTDCKILLALKAFSAYETFPLMRDILSGTCASSLHEARLGKDKFGGEVHIYSAAYSDDEIEEIFKISDHVSFNSFTQWKRYKNIAGEYKKKKNIEFGIRINPEHSEGAVEIYDPCADFSRLGTTFDKFNEADFEGLSFLHFHTLCEQDAEPLERTLKVIEKRFAGYISKVKYVNFGGGHHITRSGYNIDLLVRTINDFKNKYGVQVYLEPGEAIALNAGFLVSKVLDVISNKMEIAILDASAACHMPDVIEMPYRPNITGSGMPGKKEYTYRLGGPSCLAGDVIGDYSFDNPLKTGDLLVFTDMAIYSMVKTNTFNGINLPSIAIYDSGTDEFKIHKTFGYDDFISRL